MDKKNKQYSSKIKVLLLCIIGLVSLCTIFILINNKNDVNVSGGIYKKE